MSIQESKEEEYAYISDRTYADVHSLDPQRVMDAITLIHGISPIDTEFLVGNFERRKYTLPENTVHNSPDIYLDTSNFWYNALFPYLRLNASNEQ